jgi:hypothetical protein
MLTKACHEFHELHEIFFSLAVYPDSPIREIRGKLFAESRER